jgi:hypothetical protein
MAVCIAGEIDGGVTFALILQSPAPFMMGRSLTVIASVGAGEIVEVGSGANRQVAGQTRQTGGRREDAVPSVPSAALIPLVLILINRIYPSRNS